MKSIKLVFGSFLFAALCAAASPAQQRAFVSGGGSDANPCSRTAPCRSFAQAISQTNAGGEIYVLDSAGYGPVTIDKAISIVAPQGVTAGISVFSGNGIDVIAGSTDKVILRGLTVNSQGGGNGIVFHSGGVLHVENCIVNGFSPSPNEGFGINFAGAGQLFVEDCTIRGNEVGIVVLGLQGGAVASIDRVRMESNTLQGLVVESGSVATVTNSVLSGNGGDGVSVSGDQGMVAVLNMEKCVISKNGHDGLVAFGFNSGFGTARVSDCTITNNTGSGIDLPGGGFVFSRGNNTVEGNVTNINGTISTYSPK